MTSGITTAYGAVLGTGPIFLPTFPAPGHSMLIACRGYVPGRDEWFQGSVALCRSEYTAEDKMNYIVQLMEAVERGAGERPSKTLLRIVDLGECKAPDACSQCYRRAVYDWRE